MRNFIHFISTHWLIITAVILSSITVLSLAPLDELPATPGSDKLHHLIAYAVLVIPLVFRKPKYWWFIVILFLGYSGLIELIQPYVNRYGEWLDMAANSLGIFCGLFIAELLSFIFLARLSRSDQQ